MTLAPSLEQLAYNPTRHPSVAMFLEQVARDGTPLPTAAPILIDALRELVRDVEGDINPYEIPAWLSSAARRQLRIERQFVKDAVRAAAHRDFVDWSNAMIRASRATKLERLRHAAAQAAAKAAPPARTATPPSAPVAVSPPAARATLAAIAAQLRQDPSRESNANSTLFAAPTRTVPVLQPIRSPTETSPPPPQAASATTRVLPPTTAVRGPNAPAVVDGTAGQAALIAGNKLHGEFQWTVLRHVADGGMGSVWEVERTDQPGTRAALKTLRAATQTNRAALEREMQLLRTLRRSDYFPTIHDAFSARDQLHVVMDWVPGITLDAWMKRHGPGRLDRQQFVKWMGQIADRLSYLHAWPGSPILFRDLKPSNIMFDEVDGQLRLVDFGIGHVAQAGGLDPVRAGTDGFIPPEVFEGRADIRSDVYAYCRVGLFLLFGSYEFSRWSSGNVPPGWQERDIDRAWVGKLIAGCDDNPNRRYGSVLAAFASFREVSAAAAATTGPSCARCSRARTTADLFCRHCGDGPAAAAGPPPPLQVANLNKSLVAGSGTLARAYEDLLHARIGGDLDTLRCLPHIDVEPYDYQRFAALDVVGRKRGHAMIADDVGVGKTIEAGLIMREYQIRGLARRFLIVSPPGLLLDQLCEEFRDKFRMKFRKFRANGDILNADEFVGPKGLNAADLVAVSLGTLRTSGNPERFADQQWDMLLVDECHHIKDRRSAGYKAVRGIVPKFAVFMSATPFSGRLQELWTVYSALKPGCLGTLREFNYSMGMPQGENRIRQLAKSLTIRRTRSEIMVRFPTRDARRIAVPMDAAEDARYRGVVAAFAGGSSGSLDRIQAVLQMSCSYEAICESASFHRFPYSLQHDLKSRTDADHPKIRAFLQQFVDRLPKGEKAIIFTHYRKSQLAVARLLQQRGRGVRALIGATESRAKAEMVRSFRDDPTVEFLVCGHGAGEGLNLQFCSILVNLDLPWNPMQIEQRIGRVQRIGQRRRAVSIVNIVLKDTVEDRVLQVLDEKLRIFSSMIGDTEQILGEAFDENDRFENWIAGALMPDGSVDPRRIADLGRKLDEGRKAAAAAAEERPDFLGTMPTIGVAPPAAPKEAPPDLSFLDSI